MLAQQVVLIDCDNIAPKFWNSITQVVLPDAHIVGAGVHHSLRGWAKVLPNVPFDLVPPGRNLADLRIDVLAQNAFDSGVRNFVLCSSDQDLTPTVQALCIAGAKVCQVHVKYGIPMVQSAEQDRPLLPPNMPASVFAALVAYRAMTLLGALQHWVPLRRAYLMAVRLGYPDLFTDFCQQIDALHCTKIDQRPHALSPDVRITGTPRIRVPAGVHYSLS